METYIVKKILNNNVVISEKDYQQFILIGKGIGFDAHKYKKISKSKIESIFVKKNVDKKNFDKIIQNIDSEIIGISEEIISICERQLKTKLNKAIHVSLCDHINFAILRIKKGIKIENPFLYEIRALYPKEYELGQEALQLINKRFSIQLPKDEIGFICMHIKAALNQENVSNTLAHTKKIEEVMKLISLLIKKDFDKESLKYLRTVTHINFMIERIKEKKTIKNYLLDNIKNELYHEYDLAIKVAIKIENLFLIKIPEDEVGYLALHLERLINL